MKKFMTMCSAALCSVVLLFCNLMSVFAEVSLPEGTVAGLPKELTVMDSDGNVVNSETGEYFFHVENMVPGQTYMKEIQIMNLREDKAYHIYFYAEPLEKAGEIDLENECTAVITLDGAQFYEGKVTGEGNVNLTETPIDLGQYVPGQSRKMNCAVTWNGTEAGGHIDNGAKVVDAAGTSVVRPESGDHDIDGEITFRWIFYAVVDDEYVPPKTGVLTVESWIWIVLFAVVGVLILVMLFLLLRKKQKQKGQDTV